MAVEWRFLGSEEQRNRPRVRSAISGDSLWKHYTSLYYTEMNFEQLTSSIGSHFSVSECFFVGMDPVWTRYGHVLSIISLPQPCPGCGCRSTSRNVSTGTSQRSRAVF